MKPKDLLVHLEKGDRTMFHLTKKVETSSLGSTLNGMFQQAYSQSIGAMFGASTSAGLQAQNIQWRQAQNAIQTGGFR